MNEETIVTTDVANTNKFAQLLYGKIIFIHETYLEMAQLSTIFSPDNYWVDITGIDCAVGDIVSFQDGVGLVFTKPPSQELSFEEQQAKKIEHLKICRDMEEVSVIEYKDKTFDYDRTSRDRLDAARQYLIDNNIEGQSWTCADNTETELTIQDFKNINTVAAQRSGLLHNKYKELKAQINAITADDHEAIEKLNNIVW